MVLFLCKIQDLTVHLGARKYSLRRLTRHSLKWLATAVNCLLHTGNKTFS